MGRTLPTCVKESLPPFVNHRPDPEAPLHAISGTLESLPKYSFILHLNIVRLLLHQFHDLAKQPKKTVTPPKSNSLHSTRRFSERSCFPTVDITILRTVTVLTNSDGFRIDVRSMAGLEPLYRSCPGAMEQGKEESAEIISLGNKRAIIVAHNVSGSLLQGQ